jgi:hypothetical protein
MKNTTLLLLLTASVATRALSVGPTATLRGRVTDPTGGVLPGVRVQATNIETNITFKGETNADGLYSVPNLPPGIYRIVVGKFAFRTVVKPNVELRVQEVIALNFSMELGSVTQSITVESGALLIQSGPQRGGTFLSSEVVKTPLILLNPISLARNLPGVIELPGTFLYQGGLDQSFSVNGQRFRANNYLLDSTENNEIQFTGIAQPFNMADAVEEVTVQTGNFGVEVGRAGGGVFNTVTKSGTNRFHGTILWRYQSHHFNSVSNLEKMNQTPRSAFDHNVYGFTSGGAIRRSRTFFFAAFQQDTLRSSGSSALIVPTESGVSTLRSLFPSNPRLNLYLKHLGTLRGTANPVGLQLGDDPLTEEDRGFVEFATASLPISASDSGPQWLGRVDHNHSEEHRLTLRYIYDSRATAPVQIRFPGFVLDSAAQNQNLLLTDHLTFSPLWTNEFRFSYARQEAEPFRISPGSVPEARSLPIVFLSVPGGPSELAAPGIPHNFLQLRTVTNLLFQETQTKLAGRHTFRFGVEFLGKLARQLAAGYSQGRLVYTNGVGHSAFANFLDDFSGPSGEARRDFGAGSFYPNQFHQAYFFQDTWLPLPSLSLILGLRYENFGQPVNSLRYPAFAGFDPERFLKPNRVNTDNNNFGPAFGLAWSPSFRDGRLGHVVGIDRTVLRGGFQISYDPFFTQMISLLLATSTPNASSTSVVAPAVGRGLAALSSRLPSVPAPPNLLDQQFGALERNLRSSYTERWSFGFQRQLWRTVLLDGSYVGSQSHKLMTWEDVNPRQMDGQRLYPNFGPRHIRTSQGNSSYHAMQWRVERRFTESLYLSAAYTWSRNIDSTSEGVGAISNQSAASNRTSVPVAQGGLKLDRGPSDYDRTHRLSVLYSWDIPGPRDGIPAHVFGGWSISGLASLQSGAPFTVANGVDRNNDAVAADRPDISNPDAPLNSRAILSSLSPSGFCPTGYRDPDNNTCVNPGDVRWILGTGLPNANTVGRNTLLTGGMNNLDISVSKAFWIGEERRLELRWEALNALNHPQFTQVPENAVLGTSVSLPGSPSRFLNRDFTDSGIRSMWVQVKFLF